MATGTSAWVFFTVYGDRGELCQLCGVAWGGELDQMSLRGQVQPRKGGREGGEREGGEREGK